MKETITMQEALQKLGSFRSVSNLPSRNGYSSAANQFRINFSNGFAFQSYQSFCAAQIDGKWYFRIGYHDYSNTTSGHLTRFCGYNCRERRKMLDDGRAVAIV